MQYWTMCGYGCMGTHKDRPVLAVFILPLLHGLMTEVAFDRLVIPFHRAE
jgi:uncharacterized membrane protein